LCELVHISGVRAGLKWGLDFAVAFPGATFATEDTNMLAEKFFLLLETIKSRTYADGGPRVVSTSRHVPIELPKAS
jgi:hypothetical protein